MGKVKQVAGLLCLVGMVGGLAAIPFVPMEVALTIAGGSALLYFVFRAVLHDRK